MIIRARPKYLKEDFLENEGYESNFREDPEELFFNTGRSALKFFLIHYSRYLNKKLNILIQAFNCHVVAQASLEAGCRIYLADINPEDFSLSYRELNENINRIDVLLLTHYQGIPNMSYQDIAAICRQKDILLIDDISQTENSYIRHTRVGSLGSLAVRSFAFDKPFTCYRGGSLVINSLPEQFRVYLQSQYLKLPGETKLKTSIHLRVLGFLMKNSLPDLYRPSIHRIVYIEWGVLFLNGTWLRKILRIKGFIEIIKKIRMLGPERIKMKRLRPEKTRLIRNQEANFAYLNHNVDSIEQLAEQYGLRNIQEQQGMVINWNRFSVYDEKQEFRRILNENGIEAGNYNWPKPLNILYKNSKEVVCVSDFPNTIYASRYVVNIPVWRDITRNIDE